MNTFLGLPHRFGHHAGKTFLCVWACACAYVLFIVVVLLHLSYDLYSLNYLHLCFH